MKAVQRVVWSEGMFVSPHHLQQLDLYHEALIDTRLTALEPYPWGVVAMEFDLEALRAGKVLLRYFRGVLPDGLPLAFESGDPEAPAARPAEGHFPTAQHTVDVYLGVPRERSGVESYGTGDRLGASPRYSSATRPVPDLTASTSVIPMAFAQKNVRLLFGTEQRDDYEALKIAELSRDKSGSLTLVDNFVPSSLRVDASPYLLNQLRTLLRLLISKQRQLAARRKHRDAAALEYTASDVTLFLELHALNGAIPMLQHVLDSGHLHPQALYMALVRLAGQLCTFAAGADPSQLPAFQYVNLRATFEDLFRRLFDMLRAVALEQCITVAMELGSDQIFRGSLQDERLERCGQFLLSIRSDLPENAVADQLPKLAKLASGEDMQGLIRSVTPGVPLFVTYRPPPEVPLQPGTLYFTLGLQDPYWKNAMRDRNIALYLPPPFESSRTSVELLAVPLANR